MCAFPKPNELLTMCHGSKSITVGLGAYWFKTDGGRIFGQSFLSEQEQINLMSLCFAADKSIKEKKRIKYCLSCL